MKQTFTALGLIALFALGASIGRADSSKQKFNLIHVSDLAAMLQSSGAGNSGVAVFDANNEMTRKASGVIPGATLLASSAKYDLKALPSDKTEQLVFYCANTKCTASHAAAKRAVKAGYTKVSVLADGIQGWVKAGQKVDKAVN